MTTSTFLSFALILTLGLVSGKTFVPQYIDQDPNFRLLVLIDNVNDESLYPAQDIQKVSVSESDVSFHYQSRLTYSVELSLSSFDVLFSTDFDPMRRTMFIIHGWNNNHESDVNLEISSALLKMEDWNVFVVDWGSKANSLYSIAVGAVPGVTDIVAGFLDLLMQKTGLGLDKVHFAGHSLGAHVCGRVGALFNGQVASIVGMDPALPFIDREDIDKRLDPTDAKYVQVIHTSSGKLGFERPLGHADFYPNGGAKQKGCPVDIFGACAHSRAHKYFAESIWNDKFKAVQCESKKEWQNGNCNNNLVGYMGGNKLDKVYGTFYLHTNSKAPYALGY